MFRKRAAFSAILIGAVLVACSSHGGGGNFVPGSGPFTLPGIGSDLAITATLPARTIGEEKPSEGLGTYHSSWWNATIGGFTQTQYSQVLGFPPGTKVTLKNLSKTTPHTLDVVEEIKGRPANFPKNPSLKTGANGKGILGVGYASGIIQPGKSVTITLSRAGTFLIGCAFHYGEGMRDVLVIAKNAKPGQQASPQPSGGPTQSPGPTPTGYGSGY